MPHALFRAEKKIWVLKIPERLKMRIPIFFNLHRDYSNSHPILSFCPASKIIPDRAASVHTRTVVTFL